MNNVRSCVILVGAVLLLSPAQGAAQLLSPGKLAEPHSQLEGVRNCTNCHVLRERGTSNRLCLACHEPIRNRLVQQRGLHSAVSEQQCSACHKDHFGEDFQMVRFDTASFEHSSIGYDLVEAHQYLECANCHRPEMISAADVREFKGESGALGKTLLGLGTTCQACHSTVNPHGEQFTERVCTECHGQTTWIDLPGFNHDRARYKLTGRHRQIPCGACHPATASQSGTQQVRYTRLRFSRCTSCHQDIHRGAMGDECTSCHSTAGWNKLDRVALENRFDHEATGYSLVDAHATLDCVACHDPEQAIREGLRLTYTPESLESAYPAPVADGCVSCHVDYHDGVFRESTGGAECDNCHSQTKWLPTSYDVVRHNQGTRFELTGAHVVTPCYSCHNPEASGDAALQFRFVNLECDYCHGVENPHSSQFENMPCSECHTTASFIIESFDHSRTNYPLDGAHRDVACNDCHQMGADASGRSYRIYKPLGMACVDCHGSIQ